MWQFMPGTGRIFLHVDSDYDDRLDPLRSSVAAAKLLRKNYELLGTWPLAITAYNHGAGGMARAVKTVGTKNFGVLADSYKSRTFGFASRNFYAEFLAAVDVMATASSRCPLAWTEPYAVEEYRMDAFLNFADLASLTGLGKERLAALNPALGQRVLTGKYRVPRDYRLNLPAGTGSVFAVRYASLASERVHSTQTAYDRYHRISRGQTLSAIARRYGTTVATLQQINGIRDPSRVRSGHVIKVPSASTATSTTPVRVAAVPAARPAVAKSSGAVAVSHTVGRGQTLSQIAVMYDTTVTDLKKANGITDPRSLRAGQKVKVHASVASAVSPAAATRAHQVVAGESLWTIARNYGTTVSTIRRMNGMDDAHVLRVAERVQVPTNGLSHREHRVSSGQTLSQVARMYGTSVGQLKRMNGIADASRIRSGQILKVPL